MRLPPPNICVTRVAGRASTASAASPSVAPGPNTGTVRRVVVAATDDAEAAGRNALRARILPVVIDQLMGWVVTTALVRSRDAIGGPVARLCALAYRLRDRHRLASNSSPADRLPE